MATKPEERSLRYDAAAKRLRIAAGKSVETYAVAWGIAPATAPAMRGWPR